ncbi:MAG: hypothetical protein M3N43_11190 [Actinomycetota bacterium]|nr:hypothetical protein [Actinomycetota bacterium]
MVRVSPAGRPGAEHPAGIDCAIDAAARALCASLDVDYDRLDGKRQAGWRKDAQVAVTAWQESRRRTAEESVPVSPPPAATEPERAAAADELSREGQNMRLDEPDLIERCAEALYNVSPHRLAGGNAWSTATEAQKGVYRHRVLVVGAVLAEATSGLVETWREAADDRGGNHFCGECSRERTADYTARNRDAVNARKRINRKS